MLRIVRTTLTLISLLLVSQISVAQTVTGKWKTIDDETGEPKSIVEIMERDGKLYGTVTRLFRTPDEDQDPVCDKCDPSDPRYNKKIIGMEILTGLSRDDDEYSGGHILDPKIGKVYRCRIWLETGKLKVRGYWGPFFRTQTWLRAQ